MNGTGGGVIALIGRLLLSFIFLSSAIEKLGNFSGTAGYMASHGMPAVKFLLVMAIIFELIGGLLVLAGYKARVGALLLIIFIIPTTLIFHNYWALDPIKEAMQRQGQMISFMKNVSILGGLLIVAGLGTGPLSLGRKGD